ncbi:MAG: DNA-processing protein DprA [Pseudobdellovibrionaceae bacterium]
MNDLYSLSHLIKAHPLYTTHRDSLHKIYRHLGMQNKLDAESLLTELKQHFLELYLAIQKNHQLFKRHCENSLNLKLQGIQLVCYGEPLFPPQCYLMAEPPLTLSYLGSPAWLADNTLSVVGSREPTFESIQWMEKEFVAFCNKERPCIVSGGARGIDQKSHSIALRSDLPTIAVLPSGLGNIYPDSLCEWIPGFLNSGGCVLSEYAHEQVMHKYLFHHRNRLIAALGKVTLLVEARRRSGTLITAQQAAQMGRPVWVVPGHPHDPHFAGSLDLLVDGALLIRDAQDLSINFASELMSNNLFLAGVES